MQKNCSVFDFSAKGDGVQDDWKAFQEALNSGAAEIYIPQGCYSISKTLLVHSNTKITASPNARIILEGETPKKRGDFLLTNANHETGNENITIDGGIWDGNNTGKGNQKPHIFDKEGYSGTVLNFFHVRNLNLSNLTVANSVTYNIRMARLENFKIENIGFLSDNFGKNQDGLHFNGYVKNGVIRNIRALSKGQTNDDLIALNADDSMERVENFGMERGPIENLTFENLFAEDCHTIIRLLSVTAPIRNIHIKNVYGGYRCYAINADAARYCATPLFEETDCPNGVGEMENIHIENMCCYSTCAQNENPAIGLESLCDRFKISNFQLIRRGDAPKPTAFCAKLITGQEFHADDKIYFAENKQDKIVLSDFQNLEIFKK